MHETLQDEGYFSDESATFGDRVAAARDAVGLSQNELAKRLGVKERTIVAWEDDTAEPRANKLQMLSGVLNVSMRWLLTGSGDGLEAPTEASEISPDISSLLAELRELRGQSIALGERLGRLEKRLRAAMRAQ